MDDQSLSSRALQAGVSVSSLSGFGTRRDRQRGLVFGYGGIDEPHIAEALSLLRGVCT